MDLSPHFPQNNRSPQCHWWASTASPNGIQRWTIFHSFLHARFASKFTQKTPQKKSASRRSIIHSYESKGHVWNLQRTTLKGVSVTLENHGALNYSQQTTGCKREMRPARGTQPRIEQTSGTSFTTAAHTHTHTHTHTCKHTHLQTQQATNTSCRCFGTVRCCFSSLQTAENRFVLMS